MYKSILLYIVLFLVSCLIFYNLEIDVNYSDFKDFLNILLTVSSMVFTLMGIWIAFLYPNALKRIVDPEKIENADFSESLLETRRLESIVGSVLKSALVVLFIMLIFITKMLIHGNNLYLDNIIVFKAVALGLVIALTVVQVESIVHVVKSNLMFLNDLHSKREDRQADEDI
ncbi:hypothetical protein JL49_20480 [Pseudoalteromonas luteoviolacea]|uniref:hypothetical protein n=1 Tax=Pseudoalteromonas luteoviolacea TaxID=43657 RepID=UPI0007B166AB|nr:hypothetical protein [Pseudoalteromonas luteoviolacea]KZN56847.1 hypothetical protein N474_09510 [Pseudoalteromonas luteoviolacea CPMOR-2]KZW98910.1 hypothetical protein JL49_20480 [Pseudoalteromonas luteoviolacea]